MKDVLLDGSVVIENDPTFGSPVIRGGAPNGWMSFTSDGVGPFYAGTGISAKTETDPAQSQVVVTCNDEVEVQFMPGVVHPRADDSGNPYIDLGGFGEGLVPFRRIRGQMFVKLAGGVLASSASIAPDTNLHHVSGTTPISTVTAPFDGFAGDVTLIMDNNCTLAIGGNIDPAAVERANVLATEAGAVGGKAKIVLTYDGTDWY